MGAGAIITGAVTAVKKALVGLYTLLAAIVLGSWILVALGTTALCMGNMDATGIASVVTAPTLLVYLTSRLVVLVTDAAGAKPDQAALARWVTSAGNGSPQGALALLLLGVVWLRALAVWLIVLVVLAVVGGALIFAAQMSASSEQQQQAAAVEWVPDAVACAGEPVVPMVGARAVAPCAGMGHLRSATVFSAARLGERMAEDFPDIGQKLGFDPAVWLERVPPHLALAALLAVLAVVASLALYVSLKTLGSLRRVLAASSADWSGRGGAPPAGRSAKGAGPVREARRDAASFGAWDGGKEKGDGGAADAVQSAWSSETLQQSKGVFTGDW